MAINSRNYKSNVSVRLFTNELYEFVREKASIVTFLEPTITLTRQFLCNCLRLTRRLLGPRVRITHKYASESK